MQPPNWDKEAERLHDAVQGLGTDEACIVRVLARFTNKQRQRLLKAYKERFHEVRTETASWATFCQYSQTCIQNYVKLLYLLLLKEERILKKMYGVRHRFPLCEDYSS